MYGSCMNNSVPAHTLDCVPQLYALHREEDEDRPASVVAWGLAFANGDAVTLWCDPHPGAVITVGVLWKVEEHHAPNHDADLVWLTGPMSATS